MQAWSVNDPAERVVRRERTIVLAGLCATIALAWLYLLGGGGMPPAGGPGAMEMPRTAGMGANDAGAALWSGATFLVFAMWCMMMVAMMLPSAAPAILLFAALARSRRTAAAFSPAGVFAAGYLLVWVAFGAVATLVHVGLQRAALLSPALRPTSAMVAAALLIAAGLYQFTAFKTACLRHCRAPAQFFTQHWRAGTAGALRLGVLHGGYCVGCCWVLMGLLFVGGVMNLWWVAVLAAFMLAEKTVFVGGRGGRIVSGAGLMAAGAAALMLM